MYWSQKGSNVLTALAGASTRSPRQRASEDVSGLDGTAKLLARWLLAKLGHNAAAQRVSHAPPRRSRRSLARGARRGDPGGRSPGPPPPRGGPLHHRAAALLPRCRHRGAGRLLVEPGQRLRPDPILRAVATLRQPRQPLRPGSPARPDHQRTLRRRPQPVRPDRLRRSRRAEVRSRLTSRLRRNHHHAPWWVWVDAGAALRSPPAVELR